MSKKILYLIFGIVAISLPFGVGAANFSFTPSASFEATCPANIDILIDTEGAISNAADAFINFNPSEIVIDSVTAGTAYDTYVKPRIDNVAGTIKYTAYGGSLTGKGVFGHIQFHSKGTGNTKLWWNFVLGSTTDSNIAKLSDSSEILTSVFESSYSFTPTDGYCDEDKVPPTIDTQVPLPGSINQALDTDISFIFRDNRSGVDINSVVVKITNNGVTTQYTPSNANFEYSLISKGIYSILIKPYPNFVNKKLVTVQVSGSDMAGNKGGGSWSFNEPQSDCESLGCEGGPTNVCDQSLSLLATPKNNQVALEWLPSLSTLGFEKILINRLACTTTLEFPTPSSGQKVYDDSGSSHADVGLTNGVQYCYSAYGYRYNKGAIEYSSGAFARATPNCYMQPITNFKVTGQNSGVLLSWDNPTDDNLGSVKIIRKENACPAKGLPNGWEGGNIIYDGTNESFLDVNALAGKEFCYLAFVYSNDGCLSPGALETTNLIYTTSTDGFTPQYYYYTNGGILELAPSANNINLLTGKDLTIITNSKFLKPVENIVANIGNNSYSLSYNSQLGQYSLRLENFNELGVLKGDLIVVYSDKTVQRTPLDVTVNPFGKVQDAVSRKQIPGVEVVLIDSSGNVFVGANQKNPSVTDTNGSYGFMVPNGRYNLVVRQNGVEKYRGGLITVNSNIVNSEIVLSPALIMALGNVAKNISESLSSPEVQTANNYVAPAVATLATVNAIASIPWWNFWYFLQYLFTEFIPWLFKRKRKGWGVVYNSITKAPIDLAVIRLYDNETKRLIQSKITDKQGRYIFLAEAGTYYLEVYKPGFDFPSQILKSINEDKKYSDIYHGEVITIKEGEKGAIIANIPLDQHEIKATDKQIFQDHFWQTIKKNVSYVGPVLAIVAFIISPGWLMAVLTVFHFILFFLFRRLARIQKAKSWGVIYDAKSRKPLAKSIARIFSPEYNRMLEAYVTDTHGRYGFLAGNNVYYITAEKDGYEGYKTENIDLSKGEVKVVGKDMPLRPLKNGSMSILGVEEVSDVPASIPESSKSVNNISKENSQTPSNSQTSNKPVNIEEKADIFKENKWG